MSQLRNYKLYDIIVMFSAQRICADAETKANEKISSYEEQLSSLRERSQKILMDKDRFHLTNPTPDCTDRLRSE